MIVPASFLVDIIIVPDCLGSPSVQGSARNLYAETGTLMAVLTAGTGGRAYGFLRLHCLASAASWSPAFAAVFPFTKWLNPRIWRSNTLRDLHSLAISSRRVRAFGSP